MNNPKLADVEPYLLTTIGAAAWRALEQQGWAWERPTVRELPQDARRAYDQRTRKAWAGRKRAG